MFLAVILGIIFGLNNNDIVLTITSTINNEQKTIKLTKGSTVNLNDYNKNLEGYEFIGWYSNSSLDTEIDTTYVLTSDKTVFAGYSKVLNISEIENIDNYNTQSFTIVTDLGSSITNNDIKFLLDKNIKRLDLSRCYLNNNVLSDDIFKNCNLNTLYLPQNIKMLNKNTFSSCYNLRYIYLSNDIKLLKQNCFINCPILQDINLNEGLLEIEECAIVNCKNLKEINISSTVNNIYNNFISNCEKLKNITVSSQNESYVSIDGILYSKDLTKLIKCPVQKADKIGLPMETKIIEDHAFENSNIKEIVFNSSILKIGKSAFLGCNNIDKINIPNSELYTLEEDSFKSCQNLKIVTLGTGLKSINNQSFMNCYSLETIEILSSTNTNNLETIGNSVFENCYNLKSFDILDSVENIGYNLFYNCKSLEYVSIGNGIVHLPQYMFYGCENLKSVKNSEIISISDFVFYNCKRLEKLDKTSEITTIGSYVFYNCESLKQINLPNVLIYGENTIFNCKELQQINLYNVECLYNNSIVDCENVEYLLLGENLSEIEENSIINCNNLNLLIQNNTNFKSTNGIISSKNNKVIYWVNNSENVDIVIEEEVEKIYNNTFSGKKHIKNIYVDDKNDNYYDIDGLLVNKNDELIAYPSGRLDIEFVIPEAVKSLKASSIQSENLTSIIIKTNIVNIENGSIMNTPNLLNLEIPFIGDNVNAYKYYFGYIFTENNNDTTNYYSNINAPVTLESVYITNQEIIPEYAFYGVNNIKYIKLSNKTKTIKKYAFYGCSSLDKVYIMGNVELIEDFAFGKNTSLNNIEIGYNENLILENNVFKGVLNKLSINVIYNISEIVDISAQTSYKNKFVGIYSNSRYWIWRFVYSD